MVAGNVALAFGPWLVRLADVGPVAAGFWRLTLAMPLLLLLAVMEGRRARVAGGAARVSAVVIVLMIVAGIFFAADLAAWHLGILRTRLANSTLFGNFSAFLFPLYGFWMARRLPGRVQGAAFVLALAGTLLLLGRSYELSARTLAGDLLCVLAALFYFAYLIAIERGRTLTGPWRAIALATAAGAPGLLVAAVMMGEAVVPQAWGPLILLALGSQVLGQGLIAYSIAQVPPLVMGLGFLLQPVVTAAIGWIAYDERLAGADLAGAAMIAVALVLVRRGR